MLAGSLDVHQCFQANWTLITASLQNLCNPFVPRLVFPLLWQLQMITVMFKLVSLAWWWALLCEQPFSSPRIKLDSFRASLLPHYPEVSLKCPADLSGSCFVLIFWFYPDYITFVSCFLYFFSVCLHPESLASSVRSVPYLDASCIIYFMNQNLSTEDHSDPSLPKFF